MHSFTLSSFVIMFKLQRSLHDFTEQTSSATFGNSCRLLSLWQVAFLKWTQANLLLQGYLTSQVCLKNAQRWLSVKRRSFPLMTEGLWRKERWATSAAFSGISCPGGKRNIRLPSQGPAWQETKQKHVIPQAPKEALRLQSDGRFQLRTKREGPLTPGCYFQPVAV